MRNVQIAVLFANFDGGLLIALVYTFLDDELILPASLAIYVFVWPSRLSENRLQPPP